MIMFVTSQAVNRAVYSVSIITPLGARKCSPRGSRSPRFAGLQRLVRGRHEDLSGLCFGALVGVQREHTLEPGGCQVMRSSKRRALRARLERVR